MSFPWRIEPQNDDERFMLEALKEAWKAFKADEVPVGAVLVKDNHIIARGYNQVEMLKDATAHAEMLCLTAGEVALDNWRLSQATLYCTIEPCSMCAGAMLLTRIHTLVWGAPDIRHGANGSWVDLFSPIHPTHHIQVRKGILQEACAQILKDFFQMQREKKSSKRKISHE
ncbi:tRNA adenosine(34) deaminase TadA [Candidatus Protochlamydia phocaeensis]|uniref:tRNA adenosine(34) deaminase TadA n=1 Tax=Candidatus Protochlamydia phocaeensis TaxID=1414722 RepID=UPI0009AC91F2|nr:tRNA adenosine(34) deaminase TadA [Candidatus Protochlamydia phocaeensis]